MSQRNSGRDRVAHDLYQSPEWVTLALDEHFPLARLAVWEPAAGEGKMVRALQKMGAMVMATDAYDHRCEGLKGLHDFTAPGVCPWIGKFDVIVTNPPYGERGRLADAFIRRGLDYIARRGMLALLLPIDFDSAKTRSDVFSDCPLFAAKITLRRRIVWFEPEPGEKKSGPSQNHAWFIWERPRLPRPYPALLYGPKEVAA